MEQTPIAIDLKDGRPVSLTTLAGVSCLFMVAPDFALEVGARITLCFETILTN